MEHWCSIVFVFVGPPLVWQKLIFDDIWYEGVGLIGAQPWLWWVEYMVGLVFVFCSDGAQRLRQERRRLALLKFSPSLPACACTTQFWEHLLTTEKKISVPFKIVNCFSWYVIWPKGEQSRLAVLSSSPNLATLVSCTAQFWGSTRTLVSSCTAQFWESNCRQLLKKICSSVSQVFKCVSTRHEGRLI